MNIPAWRPKPEHVNLLSRIGGRIGRGSLLIIALLLANSAGLDARSDAVAIVGLLCLTGWHLFRPLLTNDDTSNSTGAALVIYGAGLGLLLFLSLFLLAEPVIRWSLNTFSERTLLESAAAVRWIGLTTLFCLPLLAFLGALGERSAKLQTILGSALLLSTAIMLAWRWAQPWGNALALSVAKSLLLTSIAATLWIGWACRQRAYQLIQSGTTAAALRTTLRTLATNGHKAALIEAAPAAMCLMAAIASAQLGDGRAAGMSMVLAFVWASYQLATRCLHGGVVHGPISRESFANAWLASALSSGLLLSGAQGISQVAFGVNQNILYQFDDVARGLAWACVLPMPILLTAFMTKRALNQGRFNRVLAAQAAGLSIAALIWSLPSVELLDIFCGYPSSYDRTIKGLMGYCIGSTTLMWATAMPSERPRLPWKAMAASGAIAMVVAGLIYGVHGFAATLLHAQRTLQILTLAISAVVALAAWRTRAGWLGRIGFSQ